MTAPLTLVRHAGSLAEPAPAVPPSSRFPWLVTAASTWILVGLFLDGWFHINQPDGESFFTPWHGVLYSGVGVAIGVHLLEQVRAGGVRPGYGLSLVGGLVVSAAGVLDMVWHTVRGVEADLDALLSPPHLLLITAGTLVFAGPLRAALRAAAGTGGGLPTALSAAFVVTGLGFFTQYANPFTHLYPLEGYSPVDGSTMMAAVGADVVELRQVAGVAGVVLWSVLVGGAVAVLRARTPLVAGSVLLAVAVPAAFMTTLRGTLFLLPAVVVAAGVTELLGRRLGAAPLAAVATGLLTAGWALSLVLTRDIAWSVELLTGSIGSAAAAGYLVGWLVSHGGGRAVEPA